MFYQRRPWIKRLWLKAALQLLKLLNKLVGAAYFLLYNESDKKHLRSLILFRLLTGRYYWRKLLDMWLEMNWLRYSLSISRAWYCLHGFELQCKALIFCLSGSPWNRGWGYRPRPQCLLIFRIQKVQKWEKVPTVGTFPTADNALVAPFRLEIALDHTLLAYLSKMPMLTETAPGHHATIFCLRI